MVYWSSTAPFWASTPPLWASMALHGSIRASKVFHGKADPDPAY
jgi:hypothetical protein